jgi:crotonobetainyl-CoA:carnitine CoA-transferase CaiB-like acyl-CoA transferase
VAQLERVAEDHESLDAVEGGDQGGLGGWAAQDVDVAAGPEVEVGDDEGAHGACRLLCATVASPALDGILVADLSRVLAGPLCTMCLGDLGADVIKVERPDGGDDTRAWGPPFVDEGSTYYLGLNRNKRSVTLDLKDPGELALARELCVRADVVVESFRPGTSDRLGLGYEAIAAANPGVVYCSISAFGSGERAAVLPGYDLLLQAMSGLMSVTGEPDGRPLKVGAALIDMICGLFATNGVLAALRARDRDGQGQRVEVSLMDSALASLLNQASAHLNAGVVPGRMGNRHPSIAPYETFAAADGDFAVAVGNDAIFGRLCDVVERPQLAGDERFATNAARMAHRDALADELEAAFAAAPAAAWVSRLGEAGVPAGPINDIAEAFAFAAGLGLEPVDETDGVRTVRSPLRLGATPAAVSRRPPRLGEHSDEIRRWLETAERRSSPLERG